MEFSPIGIIETPFNDLEGMPIQPSGAKGVRGRIIVNPEYTEGLSDIEGFSHLILLYHFHLSKDFSLTVTPFLDKTPRGLFSTRAPRRPNPVGLSIVRITGRQENIIEIEDIDVLNQTPLIDIKPYVPRFDIKEVTRSGWLEQTQDHAENMKSDSRFKEK